MFLDHLKLTIKHITLAVTFCSATDLGPQQFIVSHAFQLL